MLRQTQLLAALFLPLVLLVTAGAPARSQSGISGRVTDQVEHAPIRNVLVLVPSTYGNDMRVRPDGTGTYAVQLPRGVYDVFLSVAGFSRVCRKVEIRSNGTVSFDAVLEANTLGMQED
jgi:Carboxypeptidase regulatory-like domain